MIFPADLTEHFFPLLEDDAAVQGGFVDICGSRAMLVFAKGPLSRGAYLKALRYFELAASAELPVINCIDWNDARQYVGMFALMAKICDCQVTLITLRDATCPMADAIVSPDPGAVCQKLSELCAESMIALCAARRSNFMLWRGKDRGLDDVQLCRPEMSDVHEIVRSFEPSVKRLQILPRSEAEIAASLSDFVIAKKGSKIVGTVAMRNFGGGLVEVRSLTVAPECEGRGLGSRLVSAVVELAREHHAKRVFTLTMRPHIFLRLGFFVVSLMRFPAKVQNDCLACPKKEQCDEVALLLELKD